MKIGFLGAGNVTRTFGRHLRAAGHTIVVSNSRGPETLAGEVKNAFRESDRLGLSKSLCRAFQEGNRRLARRPPTGESSNVMVPS